MLRCGRVFLLALVLWGSVTASGCLWRKKRPKQSAAQMGPVIAGTIVLVNEEQRFVLIDSGTHPSPPSGGALRSFTGEKASGVLKVETIRRRPFVIADIVEGAPQRGDRVLY